MPLRLVGEIPPPADELDHLGLATEGVGIDRAFMLAENPTMVVMWVAIVASTPNRSAMGK